MKNTKAPLDLSALNMATLVRIVNELGGTATMKTFSQRSKAVDRVLKLAEAAGITLDEKYDVEGNLLPPPPPPAPKEEPKAEKKAKEPKVKKEKGPSIRSYAEALLLEVVGKDGDGRKVGHSYEVILEKIRAQYVGAKTSVACLRWYAVHMRERGVMPPVRPRAVPAKASTTATEPTAEA